MVADPWDTRIKEKILQTKIDYFNTFLMCTSLSCKWSKIYFETETLFHS